MSERRVVVTGLGAVSPLGLTAKDLWDGVINGRSGIGLIKNFPTDDFSVKIGGEVRDFDPEKYQERRKARNTDRFAQFALAAADEATADAGLDFEKVGHHRSGVVLGSGIGGLTTMTEQCLVMERKGARRVSPFLVPKMMINAGSGLLAIRFGLTGPNFTCASACASANHAIGSAFDLVRQGVADVMITGGSEAALVPLGFAGFVSARALSKRNDDPERASRPFDKDRDGFVFSEGAGLLILEELEHAKKRGATIYCEMLGFGMSDDAFHITQPHEEGLGARRAMVTALESGKLNADQVGYINAHGTSTPLGDIAETKAIKDIFGDHAKKLAVSSTKSMTGHLLGASGGLEAICLAKSLQTGVLHPTANLEEADPECDLDYIPNEAREQRVDYALSNSFGFGGHNTSVLFGRYDASR